jgi:hypothetical protein
VDIFEHNDEVARFTKAENLLNEFSGFHDYRCLYCNLLEHDTVQSGE